ncbi:PAS domain S-box protein [Microcoleus sp. FACHB-831]|uniref:sensor histidine kinase n=1 Tax=Microcoleus sp. FACHB-831 TaxID=2692827 RepID=UPI001687E8A9|nr:ATP-binding protein [Microcoleus sp. FACHB-831]MBD1920979.1 PAS domain S-box protein [Microcoleus sp. FACHB-831]
MKKRKHSSASPQGNRLINLLGNRFFSIANQVRYGIVLLVILALLFASGTLIYLSFKAQVQQVQIAQQERSHAAAGEINAYLDDLQRKLSYLARVPGLTDLSPEVQGRFLVALTRHHSAYETVATFDKNGKVVAFVSPYGNPSFDKEDAKIAFLRAYKQQEDFVSSVKIEPDTRLQTVILAVPIRNMQDEVNGVLMARINLKFLWSFLFHIKVGKTGYAYAIDSRKLLIAEKGKALETFKLQDLSNRNFIKELTKLNRDRPLKTYRGLRGVEVVGASSTIRTGRWNVVVELPTAEAYAPVRRMVGVMVIGLIVAIAIAAWLGWYFSRQIVLPLQRLTRAAAEISDGNLDTFVETPFIVSLGGNELGVLATTFNEMTAQLRRLIEALRQSEEQYSTLARNFPNGAVFLFDKELRFRIAEGAGLADIELSKDAIEGKTIWEAFPPETVEVIEKIYRDAIAGTTTVQEVEYRDRAYLLHALPLKNERGEIWAGMVMTQDITDRKEAEEKLRGERDFSTTIVQTSPAFYVAINHDGKVRMMNEAMLHALDYTLDEVVGKDYISNFIPESERYIVYQIHESASKYKQLPAKENHVITKSGQKLLVEWQGRAVFKENGELNFLFALGIDITERRQAEIKLRAAAERDRLLGAIALRIRASLDLDEILNTTVNEVRHFLQADRVFIGLMKTEKTAKIVAESVTDSWPSMLGLAITDEAYIQHVIALFSQGNIQVFNDRNQWERYPLEKDYLLYYHIQASLSVSIMLDEQFYGILVAHQCSGSRDWQQFEIELIEQLGTQVAIAIKQAKLYQQVQDFSASLERQVEERTAELQERNRELKELNELQDEFLHAVSHDLRTPIMGMSLVVNNLLNKPGDTIPLSRSILERMIQSSNNQLGLINSLLEAHSSEVRGVELHYEVVQLSTLIQNIAQDMEPLLAKNQATLINLVPTNLPLVTADPLQLRRVFENLLTNALNHNPPGLSLTLNATLEEEMIRCTVADNGIGMNPETCDRLFERYVRGSRARRSTGIGLGLYLCRQIITAHGGQIGCISSLGEGATFWFTLPLATQNATSAL